MRYTVALVLALVAPAIADTPATTKPKLAPAVGIGTAGPARVATAARDGSWVAMCQARHDTDGDGRVSVHSGFNATYGDQQDAYLVVGSGSGEQLDDISGIDPSGERIIVTRKKRLFLLHPGKEPDVDITSLGANFATANELGYIKTIKKNRSHIVLRDIVTRREREIDPGPGEIYSWNVDGGWIEAQILEHDKGDQPWVVNEDHQPRWCWTGALSDVITSSGTPPVWRWIPLAGGKPRSGDDIIGALGDQLVRRMKDTSLVFEAADGSRKELVPASCGGWIMSADVAQQSVVVECKDNSLVEYKLGSSRAVGLKLPGALPTADWLHPGRFLFLSGKDGGSMLVDTQAGTMRETGQWQNQIATTAKRTVIQRGEKLVVLDGTDHELGAIARYPETFQVGHFLYVEPLLVDLDTGKLVGHPPSRDGVVGNVTALASDGRLLVGYGGSRFDMTPGPLEWVQAVP